MTDLQVKYQQLQEEKRANQVAESLRAKEVALKDQEVAIKGKDVDSNIKLRDSQLTVNAAQAAKINQETVNLNHEISLIDARTDLTKQQKETEKANTVAKWTEAITGIIDPLGIGRGIGQGLGKGLGSGISGLLLGA